jgi:IS30 family transposase
MSALDRALSSSERAELWRRWKAGETASAISRTLGKPQYAVYRFFKSRGGIAPTARRRNPRALTHKDREEVSRGLSAGRSLRSIARGMMRPASTISREISRNGGRIKYRAAEADERSWERACRPKACKLSQLGPLRRVVARKLQASWSPEQIASWLRKKFTDDQSMNISHETIYRSLFIQARGVLKQELLKHLRRHRSMRRPKRTRNEHGQILGALSIRERPAEAEDRAVPGHWEGDLLCGGRKSQIATLVERHSRFTMLIKVKDKDAETVVKALANQMNKLPAKLRRSLTWDRGSEMAQHQAFSVATDIKVYFCDPRSPWQRGSNENTNGLLRQYFPKGRNLSYYSQASLDKVARELNARPRKTLGFNTPADTLRDVLH